MYLQNFILMEIQFWLKQVPLILVWSKCGSVCCSWQNSLEYFCTLEQEQPLFWLNNVSHWLFVFQGCRFVRAKMWLNIIVEKAKLTVNITVRVAVFDVRVFPHKKFAIRPVKKNFFRGNYSSTGSVKIRFMFWFEYLDPSHFI